MSEHQPSSGDFNRDAKPATSDPPIEFVTEYSMKVTPEQADRQLLAVYGPDRMPGTESRRRSNMGQSTREPEPRTCAQCGDLLIWRFRFCSQACWGEWREDEPVPSDSAGIKAEMRAALAEARAEVGE